MAEVRDGEPGDRQGREREGSPSRPDRRKLDEIFGDVLPETTSDERGHGSGKSGHPGSVDDWYLENRPPHHGG